LNLISVATNFEAINQCFKNTQMVEALTKNILSDKAWSSGPQT